MITPRLVNVCCTSVSCSDSEGSEELFDADAPETPLLQHRSVTSPCEIFCVLFSNPLTRLTGPRDPTMQVKQKGGVVRHAREKKGGGGGGGGGERFIQS